MKKILILFALFLPTLFARAQVQGVEYFIDTDPGYGKAARVNSTPASLESPDDRTYVSFNFLAPVSGLEDGLHTLYIRAKNSNGWSQTVSHPFVKIALPGEPSSDVIKLEFFIDEDPGYGSGENILLGNNDGAYGFTADIKSLPDGIHTLYVRAQNRFGRWSQVMYHPFIKAVLPADGISVTSYAEYFFDEDPGIMNATPVTLNTNDPEKHSFTADISHLDDGYHALYVRARNKYGRWSQVMYHPFVKTVLPTDIDPNLRYVEYYFDEDPGKDNGTSAPIPANSQKIEFTADMNGLEEGSHTMYIRGKLKDDTWVEMGSHSFTLSAELISVSEVTLDKDILVLEIGDEATLTATVLPDGAFNKAVSWTSDADDIATVDTDGKVTGISEGTAVITVTTEDGSKTASCTVTVVAEIIAVTGVSLNKTVTTITVGDEEQLTATVLPDNATNKAASWTSDAVNIATVDANGKVTGISEGTTVITVTTEDGSKTASCTVTVEAETIAVSGVNLNKTVTTITEGNEEQLTATVLPENATNKAVSWTSDAVNIATVDANGKVAGISEGTAVITVTTEDGSKTASCTVTVESTTGFETPAKPLATLYPNPTDGLFMLNFDTEGTYRVSVTTLTGKMMLQQMITGQMQQMDISSYPAGVYLVIIDNGFQRSTVKIVKN